VGECGGALSPSLQKNSQSLVANIDKAGCLPLLVFRSGCGCFLPLGHRDLAFDGKCHTIRTRYSKRGGIAADLVGGNSSQPSTMTKCRDIAGTYNYIPFAHDMSAGSSIMLALCSFRRVCFIV
jgi:hypothetical protein